MARSLQEHIDLARELKLDFVAQLLTMTAMEIKLKLHGITEQEIDTICARAERGSCAGAARVRAGDQFPDPHLQS